MLDMAHRRKFILVLAKALLTFGAPSHRINSQLAAASGILEANAGTWRLPCSLCHPINSFIEFIYIPNIIIVSMKNDDERSTTTRFVRVSGRIALSALRKVHLIYRSVLRDEIGVTEATEALKELLRRGPIYPLTARCALAFCMGTILCGLSLGGSILDMIISGLCACALQYLGLNAVNKSSVYASVYECEVLVMFFTSTDQARRISVTIFVAFVARALGSIPGHPFCYNAISSSGIVLVLPGFTVCKRANHRSKT